MTLPTISLVTPSRNHGTYLEAAIRSVVEQDYPGLEYGVIDGASSDCSAEILKRWEHRLSWWTSEADQGQYDAINKGFARTTGEVMGWLNADDLHTPWCLSVVGEIFERFPDIRWLTTLYPLLWDKQDRAVQCARQKPFSGAAFLNGDNLCGLGWETTGWIQQESTFWRRSLWEQAGGRVESGMKMAADFDLWARFFQVAKLYGVETPLAGFRRHGDQKTSLAPQAYLDEARASLKTHGGREPSRLAAALRVGLRQGCPVRLAPFAERLGLMTCGESVAWNAAAGSWYLRRY